jgi:hypothetical protein
MRYAVRADQMTKPTWTKTTRASSMLGIGSSLLLLACATGSGDQCRLADDCGRGERCVDGTCVAALPDAGPAPDAGAGADGGAPDGGAPTTDGGPDGMDAGPGGEDAGPGGEDAGPGDAGPTPGPCGLEPCGIWRLGPAATAWSAWPTGSDTFAPSAPVVAAFDLEMLGIAYVLTESTYHVLRLSDRAWIADGSRDALFPEASGVSLRAAYSIPSDHAGGDGTTSGLTLLGADAVLLYDVTLADESAAFQSRIDDFSWSDPNAPSPSAVRFGWLDVTNARGFAAGNPQDLCPDVSATEYGPYAAFVTASRVHMQEVGFGCSKFLDPFAPASRPPLSYADAPSVGAIGGSFWNQGSLWLVAE